MSPAETRAYNAGVQAVLEIAQRAAEALTRTSQRRVHEDFAIAALLEMADAGRTLLVPMPTGTAEVSDG